MKRTMVVLAVAALVCACAAPVMAGTVTFEEGLAHNWERVIDQGGVTFRTADPTAEYLYYAVRTSTSWRIAPDDQKTGEYYIAGDVAAASPYDNVAVMSFAPSLGTVTDVSIGYSSFFDIWAEAYDARGVSLGSISGSANSKSHQGTSLGTVVLNAQPNTSIATVKLYGYYTDAQLGRIPVLDPGYWMIDNVSYTVLSPVPEASTIAAVISILSPAGLLFRRKRS